MISVNLSASFGATRCHITCVWEYPCNSNSGGPLPPTRAKMRPDRVLIHSEPKPGNRSARSGMEGAPFAAGRCLKHCLALPLARPGVMPSGKTNQQEQKRGSAMSIDFEVPAEAKAIREKVRKWV